MARRHAAEPLSILYRDEAIVAVDKPAGWLVHRSLLDAGATEFVLQRLRDQLGLRVYPVHRLDRPVSGVLLFALAPEVAHALAGQFASGQVEKSYLAIVRGHTPDAGEIDHPLVEPRDAIADRLVAPDKSAQPALTAFVTRARSESPWPVGRYASARHSLVEVYPRTGRRHQIRRHFKHIAHPIVGDTTYGDGRHNQLFRERLGLDRLLLAAIRLVLHHPRSGVPLVIEAPLSGAFARIVDALDWSPAQRINPHAGRNEVH